MKTKLFTLFFALAASVGTMFADRIKIGDLYYNLDATNQTAEVTFELPWDENNYQGLTTANIPASVTYSGTTYSVTSIGEAAFTKCSSLTSVTIPNSVTSIGDDTFSKCSSLTSVTIPNSVTSIGGHAFSGCSSLTSINVADDNPNYSSKDGVLFDKQQKTLIHCPGGKQGAYVIPNSVTSIGDYAFAYCSSLTSVTIPNSVTSIGYSAFSSCSSLTSVTIGNSVTSIGEGAFRYCSSLTSVTIPNSVTSIGGAFEGCSSLTSINVADDNPTYSSKDGVLFDKQQKTLIHCPQGKQGAYVIPNSVTSIGRRAFVSCSSLTSVTIPNSVTSIGDYAFSFCRGLTSVTIPNSITSIGSQTFSYCSSLTSVTIPNSVTSIGGYAFDFCSSLTSVIFGTSVKVIEKYAFANCIAIKTITCYSMCPPTVNNGAFASLDYNTIIYVPADYLSTYKMHDFWGIYDVRPISAATTETTEVKVEPTANTADIAWPVVENAATYELVIKDKSGNVVCTLIFNANGQLTQIAFNAPARDNTAQATGFSFTVIGLEEDTSYDLTITAKDGNGATLDEKTVAFTTSGETGVDALQAGELHSNKILRNGQVLILRGGKMYNLQGIEVK